MGSTQSTWGFLFCPQPERTYTMPRNTKTTNKKTTVHYEIECEIPVKDGIMDPASFEKFLKEKIKVGGEAGVLGDKVTVSRNNTRIIVDAQAPFSKRYLKYLTKKFLKRQKLRDYIRVVSADKKSYVLKFFSISEDKEYAEEKMLSSLQ